MSPPPPSKKDFHFMCMLLSIFYCFSLQLTFNLLYAIDVWLLFFPFPLGARKKQLFNLFFLIKRQVLTFKMHICLLLSLKMMLIICSFQFKSFCFLQVYLKAFYFWGFFFKIKIMDLLILDLYFGSTHNILINIIVDVFFIFLT